ncbi:MAG: hypothetical protein JNG90_10570 [Planctomycetaceae bacterium]|nr:hypothetical protein [Planctomycetaceae bacterium]
MRVRASATLALLATFGAIALAATTLSASERAPVRAMPRSQPIAYQEPLEPEEVPAPSESVPLEANQLELDQWAYSDGHPELDAGYDESTDFGDVGEVYGDTCGGWGDDCGPVWFAEAGVLFLSRSTAHEQTLTQTPQVITIAGVQLVIQRQLQTTRSFDFGFQPGLRATLGRHLGRDLLGRDHTLEFTYFGLQQWQAQHEMIGDRDQTFLPNSAGQLVPVIVGRLNSPFSTLVEGFNRADVHHIENSSTFNNFEVNYRIRRRLLAKRLVGWPDGRWTEELAPGRTPSMLIGLRYLSVNDQFWWNARGAVQDLDSGITTPTSGDYYSRTSNDLVGAQIGADFQYRIGRASFAFRGKTGLYGNVTNAYAELHTAGQNFAPFETPQYEYQLRGLRLGFVGEFGGVFTWDFKPNWSFVCAYDLMWVQGLALAPEQLKFGIPINSPPQLNDAGYLFFQGLTVGTELRW